MSVDCVMPAVFSESRPVARVAHVCLECRHPILPGEQYHLFRGLWDGRWSTIRTCPCCERKRCALARHFQDGCIAFGQVGEYLDQYEREMAWKEGRPECATRWCPAISDVAAPRPWYCAECVAGAREGAA